VIQVATVDTHTLHKAEDIFAALDIGKYFCKLDTFQVYLQLPLDPESKEFTTYAMYG